MEDSLETGCPKNSLQPSLIVAPQSFFSTAGTPINVLQMSRALVQLGYQVHLLSLPLGSDIEMPNFIHHRVVKIPLITRVPVGFSLAKIPYNLLILLAVARLNLKYRFKVIHAIEESAFYCVPLARLLGVPAICDLDSDIAAQLRSHSNPVARCLGSPARLFRRWSLRSASAVVTVARPLSELAEKESSGTPIFEIKDVPLAEALRKPDEPKMKEMRTRLGLKSDRLVVYTGNYDRRQGLQELVAAMRIVVDSYPDAGLLIVGGTAEDVAETEALAQRLGIAQAVKPIGSQPPDSMPEFMGMAAVLASPRLEPLVTPLKIYSYMASGRPIVATDLPTHTDVLDKDAAILTPATPEGLAAGVIRAFDEPDRAEKLGLKSKELAMTKHSFAAFKERLGEAYAHIIDLKDTKRPLPS